MIFNLTGITKRTRTYNYHISFTWPDGTIRYIEMRRESIQLDQLQHRELYPQGALFGLYGALCNHYKCLFKVLEERDQQKSSNLVIIAALWQNLNSVLRVSITSEPRSSKIPLTLTPTVLCYLEVFNNITTHSIIHS